MSGEAGRPSRRTFRFHGMLPGHRTGPGAGASARLCQPHRPHPHGHSCVHVFLGGDCDLGTLRRMSTVPPPLDAADPCLVDCYDDVPLWSAPFGLALLEFVRLRRGLNALDIGCGTGFPLVEMAMRLGPSSRLAGIDPWRPALARARRKLGVWGTGPVALAEGVAEALPFPDASFDLVFSNNGFNNVADPVRALAECARVSRPGGQLVFTFNLPESMRELYAPLLAILRARGDIGAPSRVAVHVAARRQPVESWRRMLDDAGFRIDEVSLRSFTLRFADAAALFAHGFMRLAFASSWHELVAVDEREAVFAELRSHLDAARHPRGGIMLTIPFACVDATRV